jgi:ParB family transcriptional regulator, chromosome partitioning protein
MTDDPLNKLYPSSANVRKTGAKDGIEGLAQSIHNHGLLNNLVVQPGGEKETFSVLAGGRRLAALNHLAKAKLIPADWGVPASRSRSRSKATFRARRSALLKTKCARPCIPPTSSRRSRSWPTGQGRDTIAAEFGVTPCVVEQRLKLAVVSPKLMKAYRDDEMMLEHLMAFTLTDSHKLQEKAWKAVGKYEREDAEDGAT